MKESYVFDIIGIISYLVTIVASIFLYFCPEHVLLIGIILAISFIISMIYFYVNDQRNGA